MLTKKDLERIGVLMDIKLDAKLNPIHAAVHEIKKDIGTLKSEVAALKSKVISVEDRLDKNTADLIELITAGFNSYQRASA